MSSLSGVSGLSGLSGLFKATFSPADISGLQLWLKADAGLYQDAAKTTPAASDGDVVGAWEDQSGNGNDATQATTSKKPLLKLNIVNGKPVVRFDGADDILRADNVALASASALTGIVVVKWATARAWDVPYGTGLGWEFGFTFWLDSAIEYVGLNSLNSDLYGIAYNATTGFAIYTSTFYNNDYASYELRIDGIDRSVSQKFGTSLDRTFADGISIGADVYNSTKEKGHLPGDIAELLIYDSALSTANRQQVENYLNGKYNVY